MNRNAEDALYKQVAALMKICYPTVLYRFDFGAGAFLSGNFRLMNLQKAIQIENDKCKWPDFFVAEPAIIDGQIYHGMFLEMKAEGEQVFRKNGNYVSDHVRVQAMTLQDLEGRGYFAKFAIGIVQVETFVDSYLSYTKHKKVRQIKF